MAPEILTMMEPPAIGTKTGDVYSFGIIMNELALIAGPYSIEMAENSPEGRSMDSHERTHTEIKRKPEHAHFHLLRTSNCIRKQGHIYCGI